VVGKEYRQCIGVRRGLPGHVGDHRGHVGAWEVDREVICFDLDRYRVHEKYIWAIEKVKWNISINMFNQQFTPMITASLINFTEVITIV